MPSWLEELHTLWPQAAARFAHLRDAGQLARAVYRDASAAGAGREHGAARCAGAARCGAHPWWWHGRAAGLPGAAARACGGVPALESMADAVVPVRPRWLGEGA
ncbi:hypothetical protein G6F50_016405 [Rhizopus delemar]|uniref:Uncharacterized protein n=1 Tax=Rhizopus delemar TaxID=936053 RepID=A0A9P7C1U2_9FUNG|nr:hypothetical protein G6F50_016405 [Rhizopus delemar]